MKPSLILTTVGLGVTVLGFVLLFASASRNTYPVGYSSSESPLLDLAVSAMIVLGSVTTASGFMVCVLQGATPKDLTSPIEPRPSTGPAGCMASVVGGLVGVFMGIVIAIITIAPSGSGLEIGMYLVVPGLCAITGSLVGPIEIYLVRPRQ